MACETPTLGSFAGTYRIYINLKVLSNFGFIRYCRSLWSLPCFVFSIPMLEWVVQSWFTICSLIASRIPHLVCA